MTGQMPSHLITSADIARNHRQMALKREAMRRANFRMPYMQDMRTEKTTYTVNISQQAVVNLGKGPFKAEMLTDFKKTSVQFNQETTPRDYVTEFK
jgi:hypothetical protein